MNTTHRVLHETREANTVDRTASWFLTVSLGEMDCRTRRSSHVSPHMEEMESALLDCFRLPKNERLNCTFYTKRTSWVPDNPLGIMFPFACWRLRGETVRGTYFPTTGACPASALSCPACRAGRPLPDIEWPHSCRRLSPTVSVGSSRFSL